jgi:hypothetical protein
VAKYSESLFETFEEYLRRIGNPDVEVSMAAYVESLDWLKSNNLGQDFQKQMDRRLELEFEVLNIIDDVNIDNLLEKSSDSELKQMCLNVRLPGDGTAKEKAERLLDWRDRQIILERID